MKKFNVEELELYHFLSNFFYGVIFDYPSKELWQELQKDKSFKWFIERDSKANQKGQEFLFLAIKNDNLEDIMSDFTSLFLCNEIKLKSPPYASYYLDKRAEIYSKETKDVKSFYDKCNYKMQEVSEPEDHIALEIGFLSCLFIEIKNSNNEDDEIYFLLKEFLGYHIFPWVFYFLKSLQENADTSFYKAMGFLLEDFFIILQERLEIIPKERYIYNKS